MQPTKRRYLMPQFQENIPLSDFSSYKIGGPARFFFEAENEQEIAWAVHKARSENTPIFILGGGTNLLFGDQGFHGLVLRPAVRFLSIQGTLIFVGTDIIMPELVETTVRYALSGLEWAGGLPGTVGGAIRGNAGCFGGEIKDVIESVKSFDIEEMKTVERTASECAFGYRNSIFKQKHGTEIILSAVLKLKLKRGVEDEIRRDIDEKIAYRKERHPLEYPNIGSIFKNVPLEAVCGKGSEAYEAAVRDGKVSYKGSEFTVKTDPFPVISAAKLISESGLRGMTRGGAAISEKHPNFIVNTGGATAANVKDLIAIAKAAVLKKFAITLEEEPEIL